MKPGAANIEEIILRCFDGELTDEESQQLTQTIKEHPEARKMYCLHATMDASLSRIANGQLSLSGAENNFGSLVINAQKRKMVKISLLATAAVITLGLIVMQLFLVNNAPPVTTFRVAPDTGFILSHVAGKEIEGNQMERGSRLQIDSGMVELTFATGVKAIIQAPADLTQTGENVLFMQQGSGWFHVPPDVDGFTINTKELKIVDLGTEFGVRSRLDGADEVHVLKGRVKVNSLRFQKGSATLGIGEACRIDPIGRLDAIPAKPSLFLANFPDFSKPMVVFDEQFNHGITRWSNEGETNWIGLGSIPYICDIHTLGDSPHSALNFDKYGESIPSKGQEYAILGGFSVAPTNRLSTPLKVTAGWRYKLYFRYACSHLQGGNKITATFNLGQDTLSTGPLGGPKGEWISADLTWEPKSSGWAILSFDDAGSTDHESSDTLLDSILVVREMVTEP